jgi:ppGpp synthetase/RelA/SpoT-type nucleotidyltranferase
MNWVTLEYSKGQVDAAGQLLASGDASPEEMNQALEILNNWRAAHSFPLNTMQVGLRRLARGADEHALIAQRLKRVSSILQKLRRFSHMNLSRMQDIGGCRAVLNTSAEVRKVRLEYAKSRQQHQFVGEKDYITVPKESGYRGIHLVYRYESDRTPAYNGRLIEIQLRSRLQHAWATAVETVGTFLQQSLKASEGSGRWLRFFAVTSSAFALAEGTPIVPGTPQDQKLLRAEVSSLAGELQVRKKLTAFAQALKIAEDTKTKSAQYFLLSLTPAQGHLAVYGYTKQELEQATSHYLEIEKSQANTPGAQTVLVAVDSLSALKRAYPNYFLDTEVFLASLGRVIGRNGVSHKIARANLPGTR